MDRKLYYGKDAKFRRRADNVFDEIKHGEGQYYDTDELADIADYFAINNMPEKMKEVVEYGLQQHPQNIDLQIQEAYMYLDAGNVEKTIECIQNMSERNDDVEQLEAILAYRQGNKDMAEKALQKMMDCFEPGDNPYPIVSLMLDLGKPQEALDFLTNSDENPEDDYYLDNLATCYRDLGMMDLAIATLNQLVDKSPYQPHYWKLLGECYFDDGQLDKSIEACDFALTTDEEYHPALMLKALCFNQLGNPEKAVECVRQVYKLDGISFAGLCFFETSYYMAQEKWDKALKQVNAMVTHYGHAEDTHNDPYAYATMTLSATCLLHQKKWNEAYMTAQTALLINDDNPELWSVMAKVLMHYGKMKEAHQAWEGFWRSEFLNADMLLDAFSYCNNNRYFHEAYLHLRRGHELEPENPHFAVMLLINGLVFKFKDAVNELLSTFDFKLPPQRIEQIRDMLQADKPNAHVIAEIVHDIVEAYRSEDDEMEELTAEDIEGFMNIVNYQKVFGPDNDFDDEDSDENGEEEEHDGEEEMDKNELK